MASPLEYSIKVEADAVIQDFDREIAQAPIKAAAATQRNSKRLLVLVKAMSPYRSGEYRDSHREELTATAGTIFSAEVGSDLERGEVLEFGGTVTRSDGGQTTFQPKPHFRPAFEVVSEQYFDELYRYMQP